MSSSSDKHSELDAPPSIDDLSSHQFVECWQQYVSYRKYVERSKKQCIPKHLKPLLEHWRLFYCQTQAYTPVPHSKNTHLGSIAPQIPSSAIISSYDDTPIIERVFVDGTDPQAMFPSSIVDLSTSLPSVQNDYFQSQHILHGISMPKHTIVKCLHSSTQFKVFSSSSLFKSSKQSSSLPSHSISSRFPLPFSFPSITLHPSPTSLLSLVQKDVLSMVRSHAVNCLKRAGRSILARLLNHYGHKWISIALVMKKVHNTDSPSSYSVYSSSSLSLSPQKTKDQRKHFASNQYSLVVLPLEFPIFHCCEIVADASKTHSQSSESQEKSTADGTLVDESEREGLEGTGSRSKSTVDYGLLTISFVVFYDPSFLSIILEDSKKEEELCISRRKDRREKMYGAKMVNKKKISTSSGGLEFEQEKEDWLSEIERKSSEIEHSTSTIGSPILSDAHSLETSQKKDIKETEGTPIREIDKIGEQGIFEKHLPPRTGITGQEFSLGRDKVIDSVKSMAPFPFQDPFSFQSPEKRHSSIMDGHFHSHLGDNHAHSRPIGSSHGAGPLSRPSTHLHYGHQHLMGTMHAPFMEFDDSAGPLSTHMPEVGENRDGVLYNPDSSPGIDVGDEKKPIDFKGFGGI
ncbi:hypothetical protein ADUPG1_009553 [Aduncisulcus paluster]|uniref:Uncharacterized protein n=1 Tax=Aduncisulcus paluster TaxID=2918883 RepID=A0ABQ5KVY8_9EUKA|nr:hypothetical protein ADUPG1_009553 [Aduncisulcus paluster]